MTIVVTQGIPDMGSVPDIVFKERMNDLDFIPRNRTTSQGIARLMGYVKSQGYGYVTTNLKETNGIVLSEIKIPLCPIVQPVTATGAQGEFVYPFSIELPLSAQLKRYMVEVQLNAMNVNQTILTVNDIVVGDVYVINGQSNAVAKNRDNVPPSSLLGSPFIRSFGSSSDVPSVSGADMMWHIAEPNDRYCSGCIGQWGMRMAQDLMDSRGIPIAILNGAKGALAVFSFEKNNLNPLNLTTNYGRLLNQLETSKLTSHVQALIYYQGEGDYLAHRHERGIELLYTSWMTDMPNLERVYITQVRSIGLADYPTQKGTITVPCGGTIILRDVQRKFVDARSNTGIMSTNGLNSHDGCHFHYQNGYKQLGLQYAKLIQRYLYKENLDNVEPPSPKFARFSSDYKKIIITMKNQRDTLIWEKGSEDYFQLNGIVVPISSGYVDGNSVILILALSGRLVTGVTYQGHIKKGPWITNSNGVGLLSFYKFPIRQP